MAMHHLHLNGTFVGGGGTPYLKIKYNAGTVEGILKLMSSLRHCGLTEKNGIQRLPKWSTLDININDTTRAGKGEAS